MGSRTMKLSHKGMVILVREGHDGSVELRFPHNGRAVKAESKSFEAATNEARKWLLEHAGEMRFDYTRKKK